MTTKISPTTNPSPPGQSMFISILLKLTCQLEGCASHAYIFDSNQLTFTFLKNRNQQQIERATHHWEEGQSCIERTWKYNKEAPRIRNKLGLEICKEVEPQYFWMTDKTEVYFGKYAWLGESKLCSWQTEFMTIYDLGGRSERASVFSWAKAGVEQRGESVSGDHEGAQIRWRPWVWKVEGRK